MKDYKVVRRYTKALMIERTGERDAIRTSAHYFLLLTRYVKYAVQIKYLLEQEDFVGMFIS
jgi:hypothetical protein